jgi:MoaA/NifB/PqqE/SkfB family radical SAM enzyme
MENIKKIILELNSTCNNNCIYCYIPEINRKEHKEKEIEYFKKALNKFKFTKNVDFTGGEPTLYSNLIPLIKYAKKIGYKSINLVTNGRRLAYEKYLQKILDAGINRIILSLEGPNKKITESITRCPGSYKQTREALKNIKKNNIEFGLTIVINKLNYKFINEMVKQTIEFGAKFLNIQFILPYVEDKKVICKKISKYAIPTYKESLPFIKEALEENKNKIKINIHFLPFCLLPGYESNIMSEALKKNRLIINYDEYEYNMGDHLEKGGIKIKKCKNCTYENKCAGFFKSYAKELGIEEEIQNG